MTTGDQIELKWASSPQNSAGAQSPGSMTPVAMTVTQITARVKGLLEGEIGTVWVKGEISNFKPSSSGHIYLSLKDAGAMLSCAMFRGVKMPASAAGRLALKDGMEVLVRGRVSVYAPRGNYQLIIEHIEPLGQGALQIAFEQLKAKLQAEGLFDSSRKKLLPRYPNRVCLITSLTGAVLQDMLHVLGRRNSGISLLVVPTAVQGDDAPRQLIQALHVANRYQLGDVIIVARGGGSLEDLWSFNHEDVVRAVAASAIPVISAVGHEVDFTLCDFVADVRAPTPSAAAEIVSKNRLELLDQISQVRAQLQLLLSHRVGRYRTQLLSLEGRLVSPSQRLERTRRQVDEASLLMLRSMENRILPLRQTLDEESLRLEHAMTLRVQKQRQRLERMTASLEALSPLKVLGRGFSLVKDPSGSLVKSSKQLKSGQGLTLQFSDGNVSAKVI